jgi:flagellar hook-basal body complex protein FliE
MDDITLKAIEGLGEVRALQPGAATPQTQGSEFMDVLKGAIESVNQIQHESGRLEDAVAKGENMNIHQAVIMGEKAGLSFELMMQVRNKLLDAYQEVSRMQI